MCYAGCSLGTGLARNLSSEAVVCQQLNEQRLGAIINTEHGEVFEKKKLEAHKRYALRAKLATVTQ